MDDIHDILVIGDIHGQYEKLLRLLHQERLVDANLSWTGETTTLWFMGDFFDRGPDGIAVVDLVMRLQNEAQAAGGSVQSLLGNHEVLLLAAQRLGEQQDTAPGGTFLADWKRNGGQASDLARLTPQHIDWLSSLPAMARVGTWLFVHADATLYTKYGSSIEEVNQAFQNILHGDDAAAWDQLLDDFSRREEFEDWQPEGEQHARLFLRIFNAQRLLHGHTPISQDRNAIKEIHTVRVYAHGLCVNVDGGMYLGGPGFVYRLSDSRESNEA